MNYEAAMFIVRKGYTVWREKWPESDCIKLETVPSDTPPSPKLPTILGVRVVPLKHTKLNGTPMKQPYDATLEDTFAEDWTLLQ